MNRPRKQESAEGLSFCRFYAIFVLVINMEKNLPVRKPLRMGHYNYNTPGAYFLTFCTHNRKQSLSRIVGAIHESPETHLTPLGQIVDEVIRNIPEHLHITIDHYVVMPNHVHILATITQEDGMWAIHESPLQKRSIISKTIGYVKANTSKKAKRQYGDTTLWQRGYYDHVVRNQEDYNALAQYIQENPLRWELDKLYTQE